MEHIYVQIRNLENKDHIKNVTKMNTLRQTDGTSKLEKTKTKV